MAVTEDHVREALRQVIDPELFVNIVDLGLVYDITVEPSEGVASSAPVAEGDATGAASPDEAVRVKIEMTMTSPMCPAGPQLVGDSKSFVSKLPGVAAVDVKVVMDPPWTPEKMTEEARDQLGIF